MTKYRILEKEGKEERPKCYGWCRHDNCDGFENYSIYIPRFIVQKEYITDLGWFCELPMWEDIKEFPSLNEARAFKRALELKEGIVRE